MAQLSSPLGDSREVSRTEVWFGELAGRERGTPCFALGLSPCSPQPLQSHVLSYHCNEGGEEPSELQEPKFSRGEHGLLMKSLCWQWLCKWPRMPEWPPSFPPTDYFAKKTKTRDSFLLNVPQRPIFLLSSETIAKPNVVQWK